VLIDATDIDVRNVAAVAAQLPDPVDIAPGAPVVVFGTAERTPRGWLRWLGTGRVAIARDVRCAALLVRGYVDIGCATLTNAGGELSWGLAAGRVHPASNGARVRA
jgi:hypothetical protein